MRKALFIAFLLCSALAFNVDIQPNFIRALPGETIEVEVVVISDSMGSYLLRVQGAGADYSKSTELIPGQTYRVPISFTTTAESGDQILTASVSLGQETETATATVQIVKQAEESTLVNQTLHVTRNALDELKIRARGVGDERAISTLHEAELLIDEANSSYLSGRLISSQSQIEEAQTKLGQATTLIEMGEQSQFRINIGLLAVGILIVLIAVLLTKYAK
jgi:hypothetical protein